MWGGGWGGGGLGVWAKLEGDLKFRGGGGAKVFHILKSFIEYKKMFFYVFDTKFQNVNQMFCYLILMELYDYVIMKYEESCFFS